MNIEHVIEEHAAKIIVLAARAQARMAVQKYYVYVWIRHTGQPIYVGKGRAPSANSRRATSISARSSRKTGRPASRSRNGSSSLRT
jgi:hypothetical protein